MNKLEKSVEGIIRTRQFKEGDISERIFNLFIYSKENREWIDDSSKPRDDLMKAWAKNVTVEELGVQFNPHEIMELLSDE